MELKPDLRFKSDVHAFEITYQNAYQRFKADGETEWMEAGLIRTRSDWAIHSGAIGYQVTGEVFGIGTDLQYQWYTDKGRSGQCDREI